MLLIDKESNISNNLTVKGAKAAALIIVALLASFLFLGSCQAPDVPGLTQDQAGSGQSSAENGNAATPDSNAATPGSNAATPDDEGGGGTLDNQSNELRDYADDVVTVTIKVEYWDSDKEWGPSDFPDVDIKKIRYNEYSGRILEVYLNQVGDEQVDKAIAQLQKYENVESARKTVLFRGF